MWKAFQRYRELDPEARKLFWRAVTLLPLVGVSLRVRGFQKTKENLAKKLPTGQVDPDSKTGNVEAVQMTCRMVKAGAHYGFGHPTCLAQSLVLWYLLQKQNIPTRFRIGVKKLTSKFEAHAWLEHEGVALNQTAEPHHHYAAFESEFSDLPGESA